MTITELRCVACGMSDPPSSPDGPCRVCGEPRDVVYDYDAIHRVVNRDALAASGERSMLRYGPLLPIPHGAPLPSLRVGFTPTYEAPRLARALGIARLWIKDDGLEPTGSFKDRASYIALARALHRGERVVATASTGNAATSLAGLSASAGVSAAIFVPDSAPAAKVAQLCVFGAHVFLVRADYDATFDLCQRAVRHFGWYDRSAALNPYMIEGKKTCGHEIAETLRAGMPDWVVASVGDGCSIAGIYKGLVEMRTLGVTDRVPRMLGVQAKGAAPLVDMFRRNTEVLTPLPATTIADSIRVGHPRNAKKALRAVRESHGDFVAVDDESILAWIARTASSTGVFGEPAAVAAIAGLEAARSSNIVRANETALVVITGNGLKDVGAAMRSVKSPEPVEATLDAVERRWEQR